MNYTQFQEKDQELFSTALSYVRSGLSILPERDRVPPFSGWSKEYRERLPTEEEIKEWFPKYSGFGVLPGKISGNLEIIDIDLKNDPSGTIVDQYEDRVSQQDSELFWKLTIEETPSGGLHLIYRCDEIGGKEDLAFSESGKPIIELLGENSKCTIFPTPGYSLLNRNYLDIPKITPEEREILISVARSFNKKVKPHKVQVEYSSQKEYSTGLSPWEDYDQRGDALSLLFSHGWEEIGNQDDTIYLKRPGKEKKENSGSWNSSKRLFYVWTHKSPFPPNKAFSPSAIFCFLECGGDFKEMARKLSEEGFGEKLEKTSKAPSPAPQIELEINGEIFKPEKKENINLNLDHIHPFFKQYAQFMEGKNETCKEYILSSLLVSLGTIIGKDVRMAKGFDWVVPNIYMMLIGGSTLCGKSTGLRCGIKPLKIINDEREAKYFREKAAFDALPDKEKKGAAKPLEDMFIYPSDVTLEALVDSMNDKSDGLFVLGEMGAFLAKMNSQHGTGIKEYLTVSYDGEDYKKKTVGKGTIMIKNPRPNVLGLSTLPWLQAHLKDGDLLSGFLGRFCYVVRRDYEEIDVPWENPITLPPSVVYNFDQIMKLNLEVHPSETAKLLYSEFYKMTKATILKESVIFHNSLARNLREIVHKIAIINHCLDLVTERLPQEKKNEIQDRSYLEAISWSKFFMENIMSCYEELSEPVDLTEEKVLDKIKRKGVKNGQYFEIGRSELLRANRNMKASELDEVLDTLIQRKEIRQVPMGKSLGYQILS